MLAFLRVAGFREIDAAALVTETGAQAGGRGISGKHSAEVRSMPIFIGLLESGTFREIAAAIVPRPVAAMAQAPSIAGTMPTVKVL